MNLGADAALAARAQASGNDILFTSADGTTKLAHEIEIFTSSTGALTAWVRVPVVSASVDTVLYLYYGNGAASNQQNPTGVWDTNFRGVWHLQENGTLPQDSTSNANNATSGTLPTRGAAIIGSGQTFDGTTQSVGIPHTASLALTNTGTFSVWFRFTEVRESDLFEKGGVGGYTAWQSASQMWWGPQTGTVAQWSTSAALVTGRSGTGSTGPTTPGSRGNTSTGTWSRRAPPPTASTTTVPCSSAMASTGGSGAPWTNCAFRTSSAPWAGSGPSSTTRARRRPSCRWAWKTRRRRSPT